MTDGASTITSAELEEIRAVNRTLREAGSAVPPMHLLPVEEARRRVREGQPGTPPPVRLEQGQDRSIDGPAGPIPIRVFVPGEVHGAYLYLHGGGWVVGDAAVQDKPLWRMATRAGVAVVSVDYRLAPDHPFPAGPDDCEAAARWLVDHAPHEFGTDRLVIGGASAGAHLAALTLLRLRDAGLGGSFAGADLVFGPYDLSLTPSARLADERNVAVSAEELRWYCDLFLPGRDAEARRDPAISPLYAPLHDLPPARFTVGGLDLLLDDTLFMEARWRHAGNPTELHVVPEAVHGFTFLPMAAAKKANDACYAFVRRAVGR